MRDLGADFVRVGDIWVKFPKQESVHEQVNLSNPASYAPDSAPLQETHYGAPAAEQGLDESDHAELAKRAGVSEPQPDTMAWFKQEAVPRGDD